MKLSDVKFRNNFEGFLPVDQERENFTRQVSHAFCSYVNPTPVKDPQIVAWSEDVGALLGVERPEKGSLGTEILSGNHVPAGMRPYAVCYGGHQFGVWAGQLGDGRAINLGRVGEAPGWQIQLKGAGPTPYSRRADGRAVLRSCIREYLASECMHYLGVPTTRALATLVTGDNVPRDMFYNGNIREEPGAITVRVARSFIRFGNFQILAARKEASLLQQLVNYIMQHYFPQSESCGEFFQEVCERTARVVSHWMRVGFVHAVMNTDNLSILGDTIDYGPFGWLDDFRSDWTPNTSDLPGRRYCFGNQPAAAMWNLERLAEALSFTSATQSELSSGLGRFAGLFKECFYTDLGNKLGLASTDDSEDKRLIDELYVVLHNCGFDMTIFFRNLKKITGDTDKETLLSVVQKSSYQPEEAWQDEFLPWAAKYQARLNNNGLSPDVRSECMDKVNPAIVPRNYICQQVIEKAESGDFSSIDETLAVFRNPYIESGENEKFREKRPDWAKDKAGCSQLSCSS